MNKGLVIRRVIMLRCLDIIQTAKQFKATLIGTNNHGIYVLTLYL